jgi:hypothetical protein
MEFRSPWMMAFGLQLDDFEPDERLLAHREAVREAKRAARRDRGRGLAPFRRVAAWAGLAPSRTAAHPMTDGCTA